MECKVMKCKCNVDVKKCDVHTFTLPCEYVMHCYVCMYVCTYVCMYVWNASTVM